MKKKKKIEETTGQKYNVLICYAGRPINKRFGNELQVLIFRVI